jgi:hypothetical protein
MKISPYLFILIEFGYAKYFPFSLYLFKRSLFLEWKFKRFVLKTNSGLVMLSGYFVNDFLIR